MKVAVIGIGSNSVRMLVAEVEGHAARRIRRDRAGTRLFAGLDARRNLSPESMETTVRAVAGMAASARAEGAEQVLLFATSATRDAANADVLRQRLLEEAGAELVVCSGDTEASLSYLGASQGGFSGVIDIGGGSTELIAGHDLEINWAFSCQMGAVRLFRLMPIQSAADLPRVEAEALRILEDKLTACAPAALPARWIGTGGTFTTLAAMVRGVPWQDRSCLHGTALPLARVEELARELADMPMAQRLTLPGLQPGRADIVVHGMCILIACMRRLGIAEITVSESGNLDGYLKRAYRLEQLN